MSAHLRLRGTVIAVSILIVVALASPVAAAVTPSKATNLRAKTTTSSATLSWSKPKNAKSYNVCLYTSGKSRKCVRHYKGLKKTSLTVTKLKPTSGTDYFFVVSAYNGSKRATTRRVGFNLAKPTKLPTLAKPTNLRAKTTQSAATLSWTAPKVASAYRVCLYTSGTARNCVRAYTALKQTSLTVTGLKPTGGTDYFFTVTVYSGKLSATTGRVGFNLAPPPPPPTPAKATNLRAFPSMDSATLTWSAPIHATSYAVCLYTSGTATTCVKRYTGITTTSFTAKGLKPTGGTDYYFSVLAYNGSRFSQTGRVPFDLTTTPPVTGPFQTSVLSYNLCGQDKCLTTSNGMQKWNPVRKPLAGKLVRSTNSDIVATQESQKTDTNFGTELPGYELGCYRSSKSLFFKSAKYTRMRPATVGGTSLDQGGITLDPGTNKRYACWVELMETHTGTRFIAVDAHLEPGKGETQDNMRRSQTELLISSVARINPDGLPVVYAGDFNSNGSNANQSKYLGGYDAPLPVMAGAGYLDSFVSAAVSQTLSHGDWNSANQAISKISDLKRSGYHIDKVFVEGSIEVNSARVVLDLNTAGTTYRTPFASDHNPIQAILTIPGNR